MTSLPEQFSAARLAQLDNGFNLMRSFSDQALDRTSRVLALQFQASRNAVEQSSSALRHLLEARDPRDLLALGAESQQYLQQHLQQNLRTLFDYSRELFSAATGAEPLRSYSVDALNAITTANAAAAQQTVDAAVASITPDAPVAEATVIPVVTSDVEPSVEPTPIAKAASEVLDVPVAPPHPVAASVPVEVSVEIELPKIEPIEATPPVVIPATTKVTEIRGTKGRRKHP